MSAAYFLRGARQLLTLRGPAGVRRGAALRDLAIISDGSVLIQDGRIVSVGSTRRIENLREARRAIEVPAYDKIIMPGFIDLGMQLSLSWAPHPRPQKLIEFADQSLLLMRSCVQYGTVTVRVHAGADRASCTADASMLQKLSRIGSKQLQVLRTWRVDGRPPEDSIATLEKLNKRRMVDSISVMLNGETEPDWERLHTLRGAGLGLHLLWNGGPAELLSDLVERLQPESICPSQPLSEKEAEVLAASEGVTILPAGKQVFEGANSPGIRTLVDKGGAIALSSGYHSALAPNFNMQMAIALAVARFRLTPEEAITAATFNAACAAHCSHVTGSIEVGKQADLIMLNIPHLHELPLRFGVNHVVMVFRAGEIVFNRMRRRDPAEPPSDRMRAKSI